MPLIAGTQIADGEEVVVVRTSDRLNFKFCRRLWGWTSHLKMGLQLKEQADYFWFGSGIHYALEDFHGYNVYGHPGKAFLAYIEGHRQVNGLPATWEEFVLLGTGMMSYYHDYWLKNRQPYQTLFIDGVPQVEVNAFFDLGVRDKYGRRVLYGLTLDRVAIDEYEQLWLCEYKTAKQYRTFHYETDEQVTAYCWGVWKLYGRPVAGTMYYQFKKALPILPRILSDGSVSTDSRQPTTAALYRKMLLDIYGDLKIAPAKNIKMLNDLIFEEDEGQDRFIRREGIERNEHQLLMFEKRIMLELEDILNEDLPLYPNQSKDCAWRCPLQHACISMEDGTDYESTLATYARRPNMGLALPTEKELKWRNYLPEPRLVELPPEAEMYQQLVQEVQQSTKSVPLEHQGLSPEEAFLSELEG
jgi:hypothetical protein